MVRAVALRAVARLNVLLVSGLRTANAGVLAALVKIEAYLTFGLWMPLDHG